MNPGPGKVEIYNGSNIYFDEARWAAIRHRNLDAQSWRKFTTEILIDVYGYDLHLYSAKGMRGTIGIDARLYNAIYSKYNKGIHKFLNIFLRF